jgi:murein endopeptidase
VARRLHVPRRAHAARRRASERTIALPHASRAIGRPSDGRLEGGVVLPAAGRDFFTWTLATGETPSPDWRRVGTDTLVSWLQGVLRYFRATHPGAPRIGISDLSLPQGGPFGPGYGGLGHASHQNGLDVDVLYPRRDRAERAAARPGEVDRVLSQQLVDTFVAAGAQFCFVGQHLGLGGPAAVVQAIPHHDDHVHVRIAPLG